MIKLKPGFHIITLGTRGFSRVRWEFLVLAEGRHSFGCRPKPRAEKRVTIKSWQKPETALEKSLAPRVPYHRYHRCDRCGRLEKKNFSDHSDHKKPLSSDHSDRSDNNPWDIKSSISAIVVTVIAELFFLSDRSVHSPGFTEIVAIISKPGLIYRSNHPPFLLNCYLYALQTHRTHSSELRLLLV